MGEPRWSAIDWWTLAFDVLIILALVALVGRL